MKEIIIKYTSPHGRQEERSFESDTQVVDLRMRAALSVDLSALEECTKTETLDISHNLIESVDLSPLGELKALRRLRLQDNRLKKLDLWSLAKCHALESIDVSSNRLATLDVTPVFTCNEIRMDSTVVLTSDSILKYVASQNDLKNRFHSVRTDRSSWTATPIIIWTDYEELIRRLGWRVVCDRIRSILERAPPRYWFHLQRGLLEGLGMDELAGLDGDPRRLLDVASDNDDSESALDSIYDRAVELLSNQITTGGPTLFLNIGKMRNTRASKLIPEITMQRHVEMESLSIPVLRGRAFLQSLWLTSHGFQLLKALRIGLSTDSRGLEEVKAAVAEMGYDLRIERVDSVQRIHWKETTESYRAFVFSQARDKHQLM
ncbi:MAG: leucine-rich repeat domain-containing protein [Promethearchaeota archaeon]